MSAPPAAVWPVVLNRNLVERPVPTQMVGPARDALLPWLAMGYIPVDTAGEGLCGFRSLAGSIAAAINLYGIVLSAGTPLPTLQSLQALQRSQRYTDRVNAMVTAMFPAGQEREDERAELIRPTNIDISTLPLLLSLANEDLGTNFDLGIVAEGYNVRWRAAVPNVHTAGFDEAWVTRTTARVFSTAAVDDTPGRATIWVWNDNGTARIPGHSVGGTARPAGHWEAFGRPLVPDPADEWHTRVRNWDLGQDILDDTDDNALWMVTTAPVASGVAPNNYLAADVGHFVRVVQEPAGVVVPIDAIYVRLGDTSAGPGQRGLVLRANVQQVEVHATAPPPGRASNRPPGGNGGPEAAFRIVRKRTPIDKIGVAYGQGQLPIFNGFLPGNGELLLDTTQRPNGNATVITIAGVTGDLQLARIQYWERPWGWSSVTVPILNSPASTTLPTGSVSGAGSVSDAGPISDNPATVVVNGRNVDVPDEFYANSLSLSSGEPITLRHLWHALGGPNSRRGVAEQNRTAPQLPRLPREGVKANLARRITAAIRGIIDAYVANRRAQAAGGTGDVAATGDVGVTLPLYTLDVAVDIVAGSQETALLVGETVRLWNNTPDADGNVAILDLEGNLARVPMDQLTPIDNAFGLRLDPARLHNEFRMVGQPLLPSFENNRQVTTDPPAGPPAGPPGLDPLRALGAYDTPIQPQVMGQLIAFDEPTRNAIVRTGNTAAGDYAVRMAAAIETESRKRRRPNP